MENGKFACGAVVSIMLKSNGKRDYRNFLAGLLGWCGDSTPKDDDICGRELLEKGFAHIKTITESGSCITGMIEPEWGFPKEIKSTDDIRSWGHNVINLLAEKYFGKKERC